MERADVENAKGEQLDCVCVVVWFILGMRFWCLFFKVYLCGEREHFCFKFWFLVSWGGWGLVYAIEMEEC